MNVFGTDYDGVIINIEPQKAAAFGSLLAKEWGIDREVAETFWLAKGGTSRRYKFDYFFKHKYGKELSDEEYKTVEVEYSTLLKNTFYPSVQLLPGALELLEFAKEHFDHLFVSSGIPMGELHYLIKQNGVEWYFDQILGTNKEYPSKREHFQKVKNLWNPDSLVFVADSPEDMKIAKQAGAKPIGVLTNHSSEELTNAGAMHVCVVSDVISVLRGNTL